MALIEQRRRARAAAAAVALSVTGLGLSACGTAEDGAEEAQEQPAAEVPGAYDGPYDQAFLDDAATLVDADVTVSARVQEVVSPVAFTITDAGSAGTEPLLVLNFDEDTSGLEAGDPVIVTGTYHEAYNVPTAEEDLRATPGVEELAHYDGRPYLEATDVLAAEPTAAATG